VTHIDVAHLPCILIGNVPGCASPMTIRRDAMRETRDLHISILRADVSNETFSRSGCFVTNREKKQAKFFVLVLFHLNLPMQILVNIYMVEPDLDCSSVTLSVNSVFNIKTTGALYRRTKDSSPTFFHMLLKLQ
jgi:hypothetical protein